MFNDQDSWAESVVREVESPEKEDLIRRLQKEWGVSYYWFPLRDKIETRADHIEAFQATYEESDHETLRQILAAHGITTMFEMREDGQLYEIELAQFYPVYTGSEGFWFTLQLNWLIYASHESSLTIGGAWLLPAVQAAWPDWEQRVWTRPFSE